MNNLPNDAPNQTWITVVLITAILMIVFMLFFGNHSNSQPENEAPADVTNIPKQENSATPGK